MNRSAPFTALKMLTMMIVLTGLIYPLFITLIAHFTMPKKAGGSLVRDKNGVIGSKLIAQGFKANVYFWPRPSAVNYDPMKPAGGSNLGPTSKKLKEYVEEKVKALGPQAPSELVYTSASGLDPHISLETAYFQLDRIAKARSVEDSQLIILIDNLAEGFPKRYVNVLMLNKSLDQKYPLRSP